MISRIEGTLVDVSDGVAEVRVSAGLIYQVLVPSCDAGALLMMTGREVAFHTLHYFESQGQGSHFVPRLIGFSSRQQRAFFELLTTVKGIGNRTAESTIVELKGKLDSFLRDPLAARRATAMVSASIPLPVGPAADAEDILVALGEVRAQARALIERALAGSDDGTLGAQEIVTRALRSRGVG